MVEQAGDMIRFSEHAGARRIDLRGPVMLFQQMIFVHEGSTIEGHAKPVGSHRFSY